MVLLAAAGMLASARTITVQSRPVSPYLNIEVPANVLLHRVWEKGGTMTTCATGCSENGVLCFSCIVTDFAPYNKENFIMQNAVIMHENSKREGYTLRAKCSPIHLRESMRHSRVTSLNQPLKRRTAFGGK